MTDEEFEESDEGFDSDDQFDEVPKSARARFSMGIPALVATILIVIIFILNSGSWVSGDERFILFGRGPGVDLLEIGNQVLLNGQAVGQIVDLQFDEFELVASIELSVEFRGKLSLDSRFVVSVLNAWSPTNVGVVLVPKQAKSANDRLFSGAGVNLEKAPLVDVASSSWIWALVGCAFLVLFVVYKTIKKLMVLVVGSAVIFGAWYYAKDFVDTSLVEEMISRMMDK
jgi:hypothetical protein